MKGRVVQLLRAHPEDEAAGILELWGATIKILRNRLLQKEKMLLQRGDPGATPTKRPS